MFGIRSIPHLSQIEGRWDSFVHYFLFRAPRSIRVFIEELSFRENAVVSISSRDIAQMVATSYPPTTWYESVATLNFMALLIR